MAPMRNPYCLACGAAALLIAACDGADDRQVTLAELDAELAAADRDPAVTDAIEYMIMVDPDLARQSNRLRVREAAPPRAPYPAAKYRDPPADGDAAPACAAARFERGGAWAERLGLPLYPGARISDAAGSASEGCGAVYAGFASAEPPARLLDWYRERTRAAGYETEYRRRGEDHVLTGRRGGKDGFYLLIGPASEGSEAALLVRSGS